MKYSFMAGSNVGRAALIIAISLMLCACSLRQATPFSVIAPAIDSQAFKANEPAVDWALAVRRPVTDRTRDSEQILVRSDGYRLLPYAGAVWLDAAPDLLRALMIEALASSGAFAAVDRVGRGGDFLVLETEILRFEAVDEGTGSLAVELGLRASLVNPRGGVLVAGETFRMREVAVGTSLDGLIPAFESALTDLLVAIGQWAMAADERSSL
jgi:ABC-type uncharacterized transport system auxiliary subunit